MAIAALSGWTNEQKHGELFGWMLEAFDGAVVGVCRGAFLMQFMMQGAIVILTALGGEAKGVAFGKARLAPATTAVGARPGWRRRPKIARIGHRGAGVTACNSAGTIQNVELFAVDGPTRVCRLLPVF
jgi:hypothetical protein